jgi:hypothetical protein
MRVRRNTYRIKIGKPEVKRPLEDGGLGWMIILKQEVLGRTNLHTCPMAVGAIITLAM